jgi:hypothetical protein
LLVSRRRDEIVLLVLLAPLCLMTAIVLALALTRA